MNNYNQSSTGLNIDLNLSYDIFGSQTNFNENIVRSNNFKDFFVYVDYDNLSYKLGYDPKKIDIDDLYKFDETRVNKIKFMKHIINELGYIYSDIKDLSIRDMCNDHLEFNDINDLYCLILSSDIKYKKLYDVINITGYSQGDQASIIVLSDIFCKAWGCDTIDLDSLTEEIKHYFYDSPIIARITINDEEYYNEELDGMYLYYDEDQKEIFINEVIKYYNNLDPILLRSELEKIVPNELNYV